MKLATWNINSLTVRLPQVLEWLAANPVDVLALQELKLSDDKFPLAELQAAGYTAAVFGQKTYNGVALLSRSPIAQMQKNIPGFPDDQARIIAGSVSTEHGEVRVVNAYFVNGEAPGTDKFAYKMTWLAAMEDWVRQELHHHPRLILLGDFNITADDRDSHDPEGLQDTIHHTEQERAHFRALLGLGLTDAFRLFAQPAKSYSWWDYRNLSFRRGKGLRIDHILVSEALKDSVKACTIDKTPRKNERPSDHAPVIVELS